MGCFRGGALAPPCPRPLECEASADLGLQPQCAVWTGIALGLERTGAGLQLERREQWEHRGRLFDVPKAPAFLQAEATCRQDRGN